MPTDPPSKPPHQNAPGNVPSDVPGLNPRWWRCERALGRRVTAAEFLQWNDRCWLEWRVSAERVELHRRATGLVSETADGGPFDAWQEAGVAAGKWKELPE